LLRQPLTRLLTRAPPDESAQCDMCTTAGKDGRSAAVELRPGKKKGAGVGAPGQMHIHSARGISDDGALVGDDG
jgi:hypothetical protein